MAIQQMLLGIPSASAAGGSQLLACYSGDPTEFYSEAGVSSSFTLTGTLNNGAGSVSQDKVVTGHNGCPFSGEGMGYYSTRFRGQDENQYLTASASSDFNIAQGQEFTIEMWVWGNDSSQQGSPYYIRFFQTHNKGGNNDANRSHHILQVTMQPGTGKLWAWASGSGSGSNLELQGTTNLMDSNWHHIAVCRDENNLITQYVDGVAEGSATNDTAYDGNLVGSGEGDNMPRIGANHAGSGRMTGKLSNVRMTVGTCLYTSAFTPPVGPFENQYNKEADSKLSAHRYWRVQTDNTYGIAGFNRIARLGLSETNRFEDAEWIKVWNADNCSDTGAWQLDGQAWTYDAGSPKRFKYCMYSSVYGDAAATNRNGHYRVDYSDDNTNWTEAWMGMASNNCEWPSYWSDATRCGLILGQGMRKQDATNPNDGTEWSSKWSGGFDQPISAAFNGTIQGGGTGNGQGRTGGNQVNIQMSGISIPIYDTLQLYCEAHYPSYVKVTIGGVDYVRNCASVHTFHNTGTLTNVETYNNGSQGRTYFAGMMIDGVQLVDNASGGGGSSAFSNSYDIRVWCDGSTAWHYRAISINGTEVWDGNSDPGVQFLTFTGYTEFTAIRVTRVGQGGKARLSKVAVQKNGGGYNDLVDGVDNGFGTVTWSSTGTATNGFGDPAADAFDGDDMDTSSPNDTGVGNYVDYTFTQFT